MPHTPPHAAARLCTIVHRVGQGSLHVNIKSRPHANLVLCALTDNGFWTRVLLHMGQGLLRAVQGSTMEQWLRQKNQAQARGKSPQGQCWGWREREASVFWLSDTRPLSTVRQRWAHEWLFPQEGRRCLCSWHPRLKSQRILCFFSSLIPKEREENLSRLSEREGSTTCPY